MILAVVAAALAAPNVVLISVDTLRADHLGCYGYDHPTSPHIDRFAEGALLFEDCVCEVPLTNPSFGALMTGRYPRATGVTRNGLPMPPDVPTVAERFRAAGYHTFCVQSNWTLKRKLSGLDRGFDIYDDDFHTRRWGLIKSERYADEVNRIALDLLARRDPDRPFFAWIHYSDPHAPYRFHRDLDPSGAAYGHDRVGRTRRNYDSEVAYTDRHIAALLEALPSDNTFVVFVADHGESLHEHHYLGHGRRIYQTCVRVPLLVRGPGIAPGRTRTPARVLDLGVTLLALAGLDAPEGMGGRNLLDPSASAPEARFIETYGGAVPNLPGAKAIMADRPPLRLGVIQDGWKLILDGPRAELYHLPEDPLEEIDRAGAEPDRVQTLKALVEEFDRGVARGRPEGADLTEQDLDALKSLGYID